MLYFLSFLCSQQGAPKDNDGERGGSNCGTHLADTALVSTIITTDSGEQLPVTEQPRCFTIKNAFDTQNGVFFVCPAIV